MVKNQRNEQRAAEQKFDAERIQIRVKGGLEPQLHEVEDVNGGANKEDLHCRVVERYVVDEQVKITCDENGRVKNLRLERNA